MCPTVYTLDSAEFTIGADRLGIVHAPGYALYLVFAHLFSWLPIGDTGYRTNLFSAVCLALTAPLVERWLANWVTNRWVTIAATGALIWSYYVWSTGIVAEIYAPQLLSLALLLNALGRLDAERPARQVAWVGLWMGVAVAVHPVSLLLAPGVVVAVRLNRVPWRWSILAAGLASVVFLVTLLYFPLRAAAEPQLNMAGTYNAAGDFEAVDLQTVDGIIWLISGQQFSAAFFAHGIIPNIGRVFPLFWSNYLGIGLVIGCIGVYQMFRTARRFFWGWLVLIGPYTYFYATYDVVDVETMFGPTYLLWAAALAFGLWWFWEHIPVIPLRPILVTGCALLFLVVNYPRLDISDDYSVRLRAEAIMDELPPDAVVLGEWWDIVPLQYLQMVEEQRSDVTLKNVFLFEDDTTYDLFLSQYFDTSTAPLVLLGNKIPDMPARVSMQVFTVNVTRAGVVTSEAVIAGFIFTGVP